MIRLITALVLGLLAAPVAAPAQGIGEAGREVFIQIEAQPTLAEARARARSYARELPDVNGFDVGRGWYGIALGPYGIDEAARRLDAYRREGRIARDSYIADIDDYGQRFWPAGAGPLAPAAPQPSVETRSATGDPGTLSRPVTLETRAEALAGERRLTRDERAELQVALEWAGFYGGRIDAAFGPGTRGAMSRWQRENGFEATGVLTTRQRAELLRQYNAVLKELELETVRDTRAGIEIALPLGVVAYDRHEAPFVHYAASGELAAQVLLISQPGDAARLAALYDIMQTLEIVPARGPRALEEDAFTLTGEGAGSVSHTRAWLEDGAIKGFTLIWPTGDEDRRTRLVQEMERSFARLPGTLEPIVTPQGAQRLDLLAGLEMRRPERARSGFFVDPDGAVLTTAEAVRGCGRITLDESFEAQVAHLDAARGIAVLRPNERLAPRRVAQFRQETPTLMSRIAVAGYSYEGRLGAATVTFGQLAEQRGLDGETHLKRLALEALDGDAGGPVLDAGGSVLGMLVPHDTPGRSLPDGVSFAATNGALNEALAQGGVTPRMAAAGGALSPEALTDHAAEMTVLVSCWG